MRIRTLTGFSLLFFLLACFRSDHPASDEGELAKVRKSNCQRSRRAGKASKKHELKQDWSRSEPRDGEEWFARGYQLHNSDRYPEAIEAFKRAADLGHRKAHRNVQHRLWLLAAE